MKPFYKLSIKPVLSITTTPFFVFVEIEFNGLVLEGLKLAIEVLLLDNENKLKLQENK